MQITKIVTETSVIEIITGPKVDELIAGLQHLSKLALPEPEFKVQPLYLPAVVATDPAMTGWVIKVQLRNEQTERHSPEFSK